MIKPTTQQHNFKEVVVNIVTDLCGLLQLGNFAILHYIDNCKILQLLMNLLHISQLKWFK